MAGASSWSFEERDFHRIVERPQRMHERSGIVRMAGCVYIFVFDQEDKSVRTGH
jgi:hypothetical protein